MILKKILIKNKANLSFFIISILLAVNSLALLLKKSGYLLKNFENYQFFFFLYFILLAFLVATVFFFDEQKNIKKLMKKILFVFFPTELILIWLFNTTTCVSSTSTTCLFLNNLLPLSSIVYIIILVYVMLITRKKPSTETKWIEKISWKFFLEKNKKIILILLLIFVLNISFGVYHLAKSARVDEALWTYDRIPKYWNNIFDGEWQKTRISDKPGITLAIISGTGMIFENPKIYENTHWKGSQNKSILDLNFALRLPLVIFCALSIFVFYFLINKLLGQEVAIISSIFIGLSPILLGMSTIINPDALLWIFTSFSLLSYFIFKKNNRNSYLYWSGIFLGLALLTKYVANILYAFFFLLIFIEPIFSNQNLSKKEIAMQLKKSLSDYFILLVFSVLTFLVFMPAAWTKTSKLLEGTIFSQAFEKVWPIFLIFLAFILIDMFAMGSKVISNLIYFFSKYKRALIGITFLVFIFLILFSLINTYSGMKWTDFEPILASPKSSNNTAEFVSTLGANFYSLIFGILPLALFFLVFTPIRNIFRKKIDWEIFISAVLILFILFYYIASTINDVSATVRYQIMLYPLAFIIAAIGIKQFIQIDKLKKYISSYLAYFVIIIFSALSLYSIKPFYFTYANSLLPDKYVLNLKDMGDGSYEAAMYLNSLPDAKEMLIWTDKNGVCEFFIGSCTSSLDFKRYIQQGMDKKIKYYVASSGRAAKNIRNVLAHKKNLPDYLIRFDKLYTFENTDFEIRFGGRENNFVKVIDADKIDLSYDFREDKNYKKKNKK